MTLDTDVKEEIQRLMEEHGYELTERIKVIELRSHNPTLNHLLKKVARKHGMHMHLSRLLQSCGFFTQHSPDVQERFVTDLKRIYSRDRVAAFIEGKGSVPNMTELRHMTKSYNMYNARRSERKGRHLPTVRRLLDSLYPEYPHLTHIITGIVHYDDLKPSVVGEQLRLMYSRQEDISPSGLYQIPGRLLWKWLNSYAMRMNGSRLHDKPQKRTLVTKAIQQLSKVKTRHFSIGGRHINKNLGTMCEQMTYLVLLGSVQKEQDTGQQLVKDWYPLRTRNIEVANGSNNGSVCYLRPQQDGDKPFYPDFIPYSNTEAYLIETKSLRTKNTDSMRQIEAILGSGRRIYWNHGRFEIGRKTLILHASESLCDSVEQVLQETGTRLVRPAEFVPVLEDSVRYLLSTGHIPAERISSADMLSAYDLLANKPHILLRPSHRRIREYMRVMLSEMARRVKDDVRTDAAKWTVYGAQTELVHNSAGSFQRFKGRVRDIPDSNETIELKRVLYNRMDAIPADLFYMDIETSGRVGQPVFLVGMLGKEHNELTFELAFARNPLEEKAVLAYYAVYEGSHKRVVTYNGKSFDIPALKERFAAHMIPYAPALHHIDLYHILRGQDTKSTHNLENLRLITLGGILGCDRHDIPSSEVPARYSAYVRTGNANIQTVLEHNVHDLVGLAAVSVSPPFMNERYLSGKFI